MKLIFVCALIGLPKIICFEKCNHFCNKTPHTECYPQGGGNDCKNNEKVYLSSEEKRTILDYHNDKRSKVAEGSEKGLSETSSNMMKLVWDGEMGMLAKRWADQCKEGQHDLCRTARDGNDTGQNSFLGIYKNTGSINEKKVAERFERLKMMLRTWYREINLVEDSDIRNFDKNRTAVIGNVTQMIWAETTFVGCGYTEFTLDDDYLMFRFVCDYKPKANIHGKSVYLEGTPCSECPKGSKCSENFKSLCFNGATNDFIDDSAAPISTPAFYTISLFTSIALSHFFSCSVDM